MTLPDHPGVLDATHLGGGAKLQYRAASFVIRFSTEQLYLDAVAFYTGVRPAPGARPPQYCSLPLDIKAEQELLLIWGDRSRAKKDRLIVYYEVRTSPGNGHRDLKNAHDKLLKANAKLKEVDPPSPDLQKTNTPNSPAPYSKERDATERSLIEAEAGDQFGLLVNPPYPRGFAPGPPPRPRKGSFLFALMGFVAGALAWPSLWKLVTKGKNRR